LSLSGEEKVTWAEIDSTATPEQYSVTFYPSWNNVCFNCKLIFPLEFSYCPFCGARLTILTITGVTQSDFKYWIRRPSEK
jgi:rRNA maturation endonuclease Nob1